MALIRTAPPGVNIDELQNISRAALHQRLENNAHYTAQEIDSVQTVSRTLLPRNFELSLEDTETLRVLAKFSQANLRPSSKISSHRPLLGGIIVALKRLSWPLVQVHLKETFAGISEFNSRLLVQTARQLVEIERLKTLLGAKMSSTAAPACDQK